MLFYGGQKNYLMAGPEIPAFRMDGSPMGFSLMQDQQDSASCVWLHPVSFQTAISRAQNLTSGWDVRVDPKLVIDYRDGIMLRFTNGTDEVLFNAAKLLLDFADGGTAYAQTPLRNAMKAKGWTVPDGR